MSSPLLRPENIVHQTMAIKITMAPKASSKIIPMRAPLTCVLKCWIVGTLLANLCATAQIPPAQVMATPADAVQTRQVDATGSPAQLDLAPLPAPILQRKSRWVPVRWAELAGLADDALYAAWNAWLKSCEKPPPAHLALCPQVRLLSIASQPEQLEWLMQRFQPYRVESFSSEPQGLLTGYYEPELEASRLASAGFQVPLFQLPLGLSGRSVWFSRQEIDNLPQAQTALKGREIAFLADPVDALVLQIQGSGRIRVKEPDGVVRLVRLAFAGSNGHPYKSVGRWLLEQGELKDASWPAIKAWTVQNPRRVQEMLWSNPRTVFFKEEPLDESSAAFGPRGAQGVPLTPGRSIAVDPGSIPYGTPVWLASTGPLVNLQKLVLAQDTGSAITGAVRADYFAGWGADAGDLAGRLKQGLRIWVLWPK